MLHVDTEWAYKHFIFTVISQSVAGTGKNKDIIVAVHEMDFEAVI